MHNEELIRKVIKGSIQRAVQESVAALLVVIAFGIILQQSEAGSAKYYGCLLILVGAGLIVGIVWSYSLGYQLLRRHPANVPVSGARHFIRRPGCFGWFPFGIALPSLSVASCLSLRRRWQSLRGFSWSPVSLPLSLRASHG